MHRREVLARLGMTGAGAVVGASLARLGDEALVLHATPASFASTVAPACARGRSELWWSGPSDARTIALTFDDGPTERFTTHVLDVLNRFSVVATFFVIGEAAGRHPDLVRRVRDAGHEIENHSQDHVSAALLDRAGVQASMERGADTVERLAGRRSRWYRPPRGEVTSATLLAARQTGHSVALWSLARDDHGELADGDSAGIGQHLRAGVQPGDVVDLHDGIGRSSFTGLVDSRLVRRRRAELTVLPDVIESWLEQGYAFARLSDLIPVAVSASGSRSPGQATSSSA
ncbi:MAG: polysaccharide deacetylase family protein [Kineosporiaceae bacterium]